MDAVRTITDLGQLGAFALPQSRVTISTVGDWARERGGKLWCLRWIWVLVWSLCDVFSFLFFGFEGFAVLLMDDKTTVALHEDFVALHQITLQIHPAAGGTIETV